MKKHYKGLAVILTAAMIAGGSFSSYAGPADDLTIGRNSAADAAQGPGAGSDYKTPSGQNNGQNGGQNSGQSGQIQQPENTAIHVGIDYVYTSTGQITAFSMNLNNYPGIGGIAYRTYNEYGGFLRWHGNGDLTTVPSDGNYVQAIQVQLTGDAERDLDVYYRVTSTGQGTMGYAMNGQLAGTTDIGEHITGIEVVLVPKGGAAPSASNNKMRYVSPIVGRFNIAENGTTLVNPDGTGANGWVDNDWARYYFVNGQALTGWQYLDGLKFYFDSYGRLVQDLNPIIGIQSSYLLKVNKTLNCLTVYAKDGDKGYIIPVKAMLTSVGDDTPIGTFKTPERYRWRLMVNDTYTQYATRITQGFLLHSITYDVPDINHLMTVGYNGLGVTRSLGCVRLTCENAKWIYDNCSLGTSVQIYEDAEVPSPFFKPDLLPLSLEQTWDPTDPLIER